MHSLTRKGSTEHGAWKRMRRLEDNIKDNLKERVCSGVDWIQFLKIVSNGGHLLTPITLSVRRMARNFFP
jgi:hypothetical protein